MVQVKLNVEVTAAKGALNQLKSRIPSATGKYRWSILELKH